MRLLPTLMFLFSTFFAFSQKAQQALDNLYKNYSQEKVIISFSKNEYLAGETIHFKAYVLTGYEPSTISTNLYTELYDKNKKLLDKQILPLFNGSADGNLVIPASLAEDVYYIRAYTHWMLNFAERWQYLKPLLIYNPYSAKSLRQKPTQWTAKATVEGGQMVAEVPAHLAVRIFSDGSLPVWSGNLLDKETGEVISAVTVYNNEIGNVRFLPHKNKTYVLTLKDTTGKMAEISLGQPRPQGIAFNSIVSGNKLYYTIAFKGIPSNGIGYKILGTVNEASLFMANVQKSSSEISGSIPVDSFPPGILRLTLFDEKETAVAERLIFLHQEAITTNNPVLNIDTLSFAPRGRNTWHFMADSVTWQTYSVQVNDGSYLPEENFFSSLYLTSDFVTPIRQADWYFNDVSYEKKTALDALLITEKWERFSWSNLLKENFPVINHNPDAYLTYTGTVYAGRHIKPLREINLVMKARDAPIQFVQVKTDSSGTFTLDNLIFIDTVKVYYQPAKQGFFESKLQVDFEQRNRFYPYQKEFPITQWTVEERQPSELPPLVVQKSMMQKNNEQLFSEYSKMMETVFVKTRKRSATEELDRKLSSGQFSGSNVMVFDFVNGDDASAAGGIHILSWLQGRVAGYSVRNSGGVLQPFLRNEIAQVFVDEIPYEADILNSLPIGDIAMVKVINGNFVGGGSAVAIYTRRGDLGPLYKSATLSTSILAGYRKQLPVFSPDYSVAGFEAIPDDRLVLFRKLIAQPTEGAIKMLVQFYNNTSAKSFYLCITGFNKDGKPIYISKELK